MRRFLVLLVIFTGMGQAGARGQEEDRAKQALKIIEERALGPAIKTLSNFLYACISGQNELAYHMLICSDEVKSSIEGDEVVKRLAKESQQITVVELIAIKFVSPNVIEFMFIVSGKTEPHCFRLGLYSGHGQNHVKFFQSTSDWEQIIRMSNLYENLPATITIQLEKVKK